MMTVYVTLSSQTPTTLPPNPYHTYVIFFAKTHTKHMSLSPPKHFPHTHKPLPNRFLTPTKPIIERGIE